MASVKCEVYFFGPLSIALRQRKEKRVWSAGLIKIGAGMKAHVQAPGDDFRKNSLFRSDAAKAFGEPPLQIGPKSTPVMGRRRLQGSTAVDGGLSLTFAPVSALTVSSVMRSTMFFAPVSALTVSSIRRKTASIAPVSALTVSAKNTKNR